MRILVASNEERGLVTHSMVLTMHGNVDTVHTVLDAVASYAESCRCGSIYDFVVLHQQTTDATDAGAVIDAFRRYESEFRKHGSRSMICYISDNEDCQRAYESKNGKDYMILFLRTPVNTEALGDTAKRFASIIEMQKRRAIVRPGRSLSIKA